MTEEQTPARVAHDEAAFRDANERIEAAADEIIEVDGEVIARIVEEHPTFTILEKIGEPGAIAARLDPRASLKAGEG